MPSLNIVPQKNKARKMAEAWADPNSYATTLLTCFIDRYVMSDEEGEGKAAWHWDPETIIAEVKSDFDVDITEQGNYHKLMAAITIVTTDLFFKNERCFLTLVNVLAGNDFRPAEFEPADVAECAWGLTEGLLLSPPTEPEPFSEAIRRYLGHECRREGFLKPPDILRLALGTEDAYRVASAWHGDPSVAEQQQAKNKEIAIVIQEGLQELLGQLQTLPLRHGSVDELAGRIRQSIKVQASGARKDK